MADSDDKRKHFLMAMCHYFDEDESRLATIPTILNQAIELEIFDKEQILAWSVKKWKLDKKSDLYDKKCEKRIKKASAEFFDYLKSDSESESDEDSDSSSDEEAPKPKMKTEDTAALKAQQAKIESERKAQEEAMKKAEEEAKAK